MIVPVARHLRASVELLPEGVPELTHEFVSKTGTRYVAKTLCCGNHLVLEVRVLAQYLKDPPDPGACLAEGCRPCHCAVWVAKPAYGFRVLLVPEILGARQRSAPEERGVPSSADGNCTTCICMSATGTYTTCICMSATGTCTICMSVMF